MQLSKHKKRNKCQDTILKPNIEKVTSNCTVILKSPYVNYSKKIRISAINGFGNYSYLIGKTKGSWVKIGHVFWQIDQINRGNKKKRFRRNYSLLSHPLNNSTHFLR